MSNTGARVQGFMSSHRTTAVVNGFKDMAARIISERVYQNVSASFHRSLCMLANLHSIFAVAIINDSCLQKNTRSLMVNLFPHLNKLSRKDQCKINR